MAFLEVIAMLCNQVGRTVTNDGRMTSVLQDATLSQHECVGRMITCAQQSVTSAEDKCADCGVVKLCAVCSQKR